MSHKWIDQKASWASYMALIFILVVTILVYSQGLHGPFVFDDYVNIVKNKSLVLTDLNLPNLKVAAFSSSSGLLMRPISMMSFALNYYASGLDPFYFKLTNLIIHLMNGIGIYFLSLLLLRLYREKFEPNLPTANIQLVSLTTTALWLLHPINLTSVLYTVQRMTSLSALFCIIGLIIFTLGRIRQSKGRKGTLLILTSFLLVTPIATLCKENGALLPAFMLAIELSIFKLQTEKLNDRRLLIGLYAIFIVLPFLLGLMYLTTHWEWLNAGYNTRAFSMGERLLTEARVLWFYILQIIMPSNTQLGLYHDDISISRSLLLPPTTLLSLIGIFVLLGMSWFARNKAPLVTFSVLFFLTGHLLESTIIPLEIAHEHRNYLPMYGILLAASFYLLYPLKFKDILRMRQLVVFMLIGLFAFSTLTRAGRWSNPYELFLSEVEHHPNSAIANGEMGALYSNFFASDPVVMESYYVSSREYFEKAVVLDKNDTKPLFGLIFLSTNRKKPIDNAWVTELEMRLRKAPYAAITSDKLITLTQCQLEGNCKLVNSDLEKLLRAALDNSTLTGSNRAKVLYSMSSYLINNLRDYENALIIMHEMVQAAPEIEYQFALIDFLIALQRYDEARKEINIIKSWDISKSYQVETIKREDALLSNKNTTDHWNH